MDTIFQTGYEIFEPFVAPRLIVWGPKLQFDKFDPAAKPADASEDFVC